MQKGYVCSDSATDCFELPDAHEEVIAGVKWGLIHAFPSPAYWKYQVLSRRLQGNQIRYRLGNTFVEEVGACLLGGHGIPASVGLAAYEHMKRRGAFNGYLYSEADLLTWLSEPIETERKVIKYRFARQKARYLAAALTKLNNEPYPAGSGKVLRAWLLDIPGVGYKTASWIARNWLDADDVAILDIHILRAGQLGGFLNAELTVERDYLEIENQFILFSNGMGIRTSELDALIWHEMMSSPLAVRRVMEARSFSGKKNGLRVNRSRAKQRNTDPDQIPVLV